MIPKRMFFYWDSEHMSWMRFMTLFSFKTLNPDWEVVLYLSNNNKWEAKFKDNSHNRDYLRRDVTNYFSRIRDLDIIIETAKLPLELEQLLNNTSPIHYSDVFRYFILSSTGGFYSDMDILYFKPMGALYNKLITGGFDLVLFACKTYVAIGFLGAAINNLFFNDLVSFVRRESKHTQKYGQVWELFGEILLYEFFNIHRDPFSIVSSIEKKYSGCRVFNIPKELVYMYDPSRVEDMFKTPLGISEFTTDSIGYHWYAGHPQAQLYNNMLTHNNYKEYQIAFSKIVSDMGW